MTIDKRIGLVLLSSGALGILLSVFYESTALAFIGLTLTFWGCLFLLVLPGKYVESEVMDYMSSSSLSAINQIIADSNVQGSPVYIPVPRGAYLPHYVGLKNEFVYVPRRNVGIETTIEQAFMKNPEGFRITPPGLGLANLMEKKSRLNFQNLDLHSLTEVVPSVITKDLEIADNVEIKMEGGEIHAEIKKPVCTDLCRETIELQKICPHIGCPLSSSIACILTRVTCKPVIIERCSSRDGIIKASFRFVD